MEKINNLPTAISESLIEKYNSDGILILDLPESIKELQTLFFKEVSGWLKLMGNIDVAPENVPAMLPEIAAKDRTLVARLYKISRRFLSVKRMAVDPWLADVSKQLMHAPLASSCHFVNIRIDLPGEEKYLLPPHQDFPYIQGSLNAVTWWIPFLDTSLEMGPPSWIEGSQKLGVQKVKYNDYESTGQSGGRSFELCEQERFKDEDYTHAAVMRGKCLVFHTLLIHRSEPNQTDKARINLQVRFDDATAPESFSRNYPEGLFLGDSFSKHYPEYTV
jgi:hypothetical protein